METYSSSVSTQPAGYDFAVASSPGVLVAPVKVERRPPRLSLAAEGALASLVLAAVALAIHGYHPFAEDGGPYFSAILKAMHPALFPSWSQFVSALTRFSLFAPLVSGVARLSGLSAAWANFLLYFVSLWATIFAAWLISTRCFLSRRARYGAVSILALSLTIPIAGTSLLLIDPYLTARSFSTPLGLFAIAVMLRLTQSTGRNSMLLWPSAAACLFCAIASAIMHPLMTADTAGFLMLLFALSRPKSAARFWSVAALCCLAILLAASISLLPAPATPAYSEAARSRTYWFLGKWRWYEIFGLVAPLLLLDLLTRFRWRRVHQGARSMALASIAAGVTAIAIALLFARASSVSYTVARLQPLRIFLIIYVVMILLLGACAGEFFLAVRRWPFAILFLLLGGVMFFAQLRTYPGSAHIELPGAAPRNGWEQAFLWIRRNTPPDARFALDAYYIGYPGEDAQYFGAIARRSALPDYSKDGGIAAIAPALANQWAAASAAQTGLNHETDTQRLAALHPFSIGWIVLPAASKTAFPCPFSNSAAKVCRLTR